MCEPISTTSLVLGGLSAASGAASAYGQHQGQVAQANAANAAASNNYDYNSGIVISADGLYKGNDFVDISRATMTLEGKQIRLKSLSDGYFPLNIFCSCRRGL